jgi:hypothetical protein
MAQPYPWHIGCSLRVGAVQPALLGGALKRGGVARGGKEEVAQAVHVAAHLRSRSHAHACVVGRGAVAAAAAWPTSGVCGAHAFGNFMYINAS